MKKPSALGAAISPAQEKVLLYGLAVDQKDRCQSMTELLGLLERAKNAGDDATMSADDENDDPNATLFAGEGDYEAPSYNDNYWNPKITAPNHNAAYQTPRVSSPQNNAGAYQNPGPVPYQPAGGYSDPYSSYQTGGNTPAPKKKRNALVPVLCVVLAVLLGVFTYEMITILGKDSDGDKDKKEDQSSAVSDKADDETEAATAALVPAELQHVLTRGGVTTQKLNDIGCHQLVTVSSNGTHAEICFYTRENDAWTGEASMTCSGYVGDNGVSTDISEHCHATPKGLYPVGDAFYIGSKPDTGLDSFEITDDTYWVTDPDSDYYNQRVVGTDNKDWESAEQMIKYEDYKRGFVVDFNTECIYNAGSAIFFRIGSKPTAGGIALSQDNVENYLSHLDSSQNPYIIIV